MTPGTEKRKVKHAMSSASAASHRQMTMLRVCTALLVVALVIKYCWTLVYGVPLGYDPGIYRYLFIRHAAGFPPFWIAPMEAWAASQPLGLYFFSTILLRLGLPVDWLIGWIWNLMPVVLACVLACTWGKRRSALVGVGVLLFSVLSIAQFHGFVAMYWKTLLALLFCVLAFDALERKSWWTALWGVLAVATHHQTGLLLGLAFGSYVVILAVRKGRLNMRQILFPALAVLAIGALGALWYLPVWQLAVGANLSALFAQDSAGGSFPPASFYLIFSCVSLTFAVAGLAVRAKADWSSPWFLAAAWAGLFCVLRLLFYRRFLLQLDFFLIPYAAEGFVWVMKRLPRHVLPVLGVPLLLQGVLLVSTATPFVTVCPVFPVLCAGYFPPPVQPEVGTETLKRFEGYAARLEPGALVLALDPQIAPWVLGWLPDQAVGAPGVFLSPWDEAGWTRFLVGSSAERKTLLTALPKPAYVVTSRLFLEFYGETATKLLADPCLEPVEEGLYRSRC